MLEKTVLQQLQEIFPMEVNREEADAGEKIRLRNDEQKVEIDFYFDFLMKKKTKVSWKK